ncbi:MAG: carbohydrate ABC transporter permease, partial [Pseudorhodoplanes sp.]
MTDALAGRTVDPKEVLREVAAAPRDDHSEGMSYLENLPRRLVTLYLPLVLFL